MLNVLWLVGMMFASQWGIERNSDAGAVGAVRSENRIVACWNDRVQPCNDAAVLKGSVYLHCGQTKKTMCAKGTVLVEAFDSQTRKLAQWQFDAASLEKLKRTDLIGVGYTLSLPLDQRCLSEKDFRLTVTYRANDGKTCCDKPTRVTLRGNGTGVVQAVHEERLFLGAIPPIPGRFCDCASEPQVQFTVLMAHVNSAGMKHLKIETPSTSGGFQYGILKSTNGVIGSLQALRSQGLAKVLAEPRITTLSGRSAMFKSGGDVPTLVQTSGSATLVNRYVGTSIELLPTVTAAGKLSLKACSEVSQLNGTTKSGNVMAINKQAAQLAVNMNDGQTLVMLGSEMITDKGEKQNLIIFVTPHVIQSTAAVKANKQVTLTDIATMSKRGISDDIIIRQMQLTESMYDLTTEQILSLHEQGVSNAVIRAMQERRVPQPQPRTFTWPVEEQFRW